MSASRSAPPARDGFPPPSRAEIFGWCCFDFANSSFTTVVSTVVYSVYFNKVVAKARDDGELLWALATGAAGIATILLGPFLGAIADRLARKKLFLTLSALGCAVPTAALAWTQEGTVALAMALVFVATLAFNLGENFSASFLPELSRPENAGRISGYGWAFGYFGGLASLALALVLVQSGRTTLVFPMVGAFFLSAALPTFLLLRERARPRPVPVPLQLLVGVTRETFRNLVALRSQPVLGRFLLAFLAYMSGVSAVIQFSGVFAAKELGYTQEDLIRLFVVLQVSAAAGAVVFGFVQDRLGARPALVISLTGWIVVTVGGGLCANKAQFAAVALLAGIVIGSTQSASRAIVSALAPPHRSGETFGYWGFFGKLAGVVGPLTYGVVETVVGGRWAIAALATFFVVGMLLLAGRVLPAPSRMAP